MTRRIDRLSLALAAVFVLALGARLLRLLQTGPITGGDSATYEAIALAMQQDPLRWLEIATAIPPIYPLFLALVGSGPSGMVIQAVVGAATAPILGRAATPHFGAAAGLLTAVLVAIAPSLLFWSPYVLTETIAFALLAGALYVSSACLRSSSIRARAALGTLLAANYLARGAFLLPVVAMAISGIVSVRRRWLLATLAVVLSAALAISPFALRNTAIGAGPTPGGGQVWTLLWAGTQWNEIGRGTAGVDLLYPEGFHKLAPSEQTRTLREAFLTSVREQPVEYFGRLGRKMVWFWLPAYPEWSRIHQLVWAAFLVPLYALSLVGVYMARRSPWTWTLVGVVAAVAITATLTIVDYDARYRAPAELALIPLASVALARVARSRGTYLVRWNARGNGQGGSHDESSTAQAASK